jgi:hypothetical protein
MKIKHILTLIDAHIADVVAGKIPEGYALQLPKETTDRQYAIAVKYYEHAMQIMGIVKCSKEATIEEIIAKFEAAPLVSIWVRKCPEILRVK